MLVLSPYVEERREVNKRNNIQAQQSSIDENDVLTMFKRCKRFIDLPSFRKEESRKYIK